MAVVKNKTGKVLALFRPDAPPVDPGSEVTLRDELFAGRAWPTSTWDLVEPPGAAWVDASTDDALLFLPAPEPEPKKSAKKGDD